MEKLFSKEVDQFIVDNVKGLRVNDLTEKLNKTFGTNYTCEQIKNYKNRHKLRSGLNTCFKKGNVPFNKGLKGQCAPGSEKGWFKKGNTPNNHKPIGSERIDSKDGYILIKTADPKTWQHKHRVIWEQHNGPVPRNHVVIFLDGDKTNLDISNLALISRSELNIVNQLGLIYENSEVTKAGVMIAKAIDTKNKLKKKRS